MAFRVRDVDGFTQDKYRLQKKSKKLSVLALGVDVMDECHLTT